MQTEQNRRLIYQVLQEIDHGNLSVFDEVFADDYLAHLPPNPPMDRMAHKQNIAAMRSAIPDLTHEIVEQIAEQDKVVTHCFMCGTHQGELNGMAATGNEIRCLAINIMRIHKGRVAEYWGVADMLTFLEQLKNKVN